MMEGVVRIIDSRKANSIKRTLEDIWSYRELLYYFVWKELKIRYKQTLIGAAWAVLQPLIAMAIFWLVFGTILDVQTDVPYPIFAYSGLVIWYYFSGSLTQSSASVLNNSHILTKVYFPRILLPLSYCLIGLVDYIIATVMLIVLMLLFGIMPSAWLLLLFIPFSMSVLLASGLGFWLSAVSAKYRDVKYITPFFVQLLLFITPIIYPSTTIPPSFRWIININPLAPIIEAQRAFVLGTGLSDWIPLGISLLMTLAIFFLGVFYFAHRERQMADVI
ncbi:MAG: ABC transporter permease [Methanomassiliicoccales archaeon]